MKNINTLLGLLLLALAPMALAPITHAQTAGAPVAPTDRAADLPLLDILEATSILHENGLATRRMLEGGIFSINVRHIQGAETALQHGRISEVWVVREGMAILATGGSIVDAEPGAGPGDLRGSAISGGEERVIKAGDVIYIPTGIPHGIKESESIVYLNIRFELRDPE